MEKLPQEAKPLITPPAGKPREADIAFPAPTILVEKGIWLYYSEENQPFRVVILIENN